MAVVSVQSSVVYGYVGNRAAVLALEGLGQVVYPIHTVQFSNHTGYGQFFGERFTGNHVLSLIQGLAGLEDVNFLQFLLSGYLGSADVAYALQEGFQLLKKKHQGLLYYCDPVLGDLNSGIFVQSDVVEAIKTILWPLASFISPNHFEFEVLLGESIDSFHQAYAICKDHPLLKNQYVVIKSFRDNQLSKDKISVFLYEPSGRAWAIITPFLHFVSPLSGTGDFFSAYLLGYYLKTQDIVSSLQYAVTAIYKVLELTHQKNQKELALIEAQSILRGFMLHDLFDVIEL
jgi:pyridoxine kinase